MKGTPPFNPRISRGLALILLIAVEGIIAFVLFTLPTNIPFGYLIKTGPNYLVAWRDPDIGLQSRNFSVLLDALQFADESLNLHVKTGSRPDIELEYLDLQDRFGGFVLLWKTFQVDFLNQITFQRKSDALYFAHAFRSGAYSPSPFGHSVLLVPTRLENNRTKNRF